MGLTKRTPKKNRTLDEYPKKTIDLVSRICSSIQFGRLLFIQGLRKQVSYYIAINRTITTGPQHKSDRDNIFCIQKTMSFIKHQMEQNNLKIKIIKIPPRVPSRINHYHTISSCKCKTQTTNLRCQEKYGSPNTFLEVLEEKKNMNLNTKQIVFNFLITLLI